MRRDLSTRFDIYRSRLTSKDRLGRRTEKQNYLLLWLLIKWWRIKASSFNKYIFGGSDLILLQGVITKRWSLLSHKKNIFSERARWLFLNVERSSSTRKYSRKSKHERLEFLRIIDPLWVLIKSLPQSKGEELIKINFILRLCKRFTDTLATQKLQSQLKSEPIHR